MKGPSWWMIDLVTLFDFGALMILIFGDLKSTHLISGVLLVACAITLGLLIWALEIHDGNSSN